MYIIILLCSATTLFLSGMEKESRSKFDSEFKEVPLRDNVVEINIDGEESSGNHENLHMDFLKQLPFFALRKSDENKIKETMDWIGKYNAEGYIEIQKILMNEAKEMARTITIDPEKINSVNQQLLYEILLAHKQALKISEDNRKEDLSVGTKRWIAGVVLGVPSLALSIYNLVKAFRG